MNWLYLVKLSKIFEIVINLLVIRLNLDKELNKELKNNDNNYILMIFVDENFFDFFHNINKNGFIDIIFLRFFFLEFFLTIFK
jgi:hypothetical protein